MGIVIDEITSEVAVPSVNDNEGESERNESVSPQTDVSEIAMSEQFQRMQKRQLRLSAD